MHVRPRDIELTHCFIEYRESQRTRYMNDKSSRKLLKRSCEWIRSNWNAQNLDVPTEFIHKWIYEPNEEEAKPSGFYLGVFTFGYCQHQLLSRGVPVGERMSVPSSRLLELFQVWQLKLAMVEVHRVTNVRMRPVALFDFPEGEQIEYWREPRENASQP